MTSQHPLRSRSVLITLFLLATVWTMSLGAQTTSKPTTKSTSTSTTTKAKKVSVKAVDINSASETDMTPLGIDSAAAKKIIAGRPYRNKRDILTKQFVTADQYAKIKDLIVARQTKKG